MFPYQNLSFSGSNGSQNHSNGLTVRAPAFSLFCPYRHRRPSTPASSSTRRSSRRSSASGRRPYPLASTGNFSSLPAFSFLGARSSSSEQRQVRVAAVRRAGHGSPPRLDSSHPELHSLAVHPLRPPTSAAEPLPGRNRAPDRRPPLKLRPELRPSRRRPPSGRSPPKTDPR